MGTKPATLKIASNAAVSDRTRGTISMPILARSVWTMGSMAWYWVVFIKTSPLQAFTLHWPSCSGSKVDSFI